MTRIHNEVVSELELDTSKVKEGSPEALSVLKAIGERIMADPEGIQFIAEIGLIAINHFGMPTAPQIASSGQSEPILNPGQSLENYIWEVMALKR